MKRSSSQLKTINLGEKTKYPESFDPRLLEAVPNLHSHKVAWTSFICTEFTSLCPKTGQPDFARIYVNYIAHKKLVESKSLKLYLFSFRNHGDFHEDCVQMICDDIQKLIEPHYVEVIGEFTPRGGIAIYPMAQNSSKKFEKLRQERFVNYAPGKYTIPLNRIY